MMRLSDITESVMTACGMRRATTDWAPKMMVGFGVGLLTGAVCGLIMAPKPGREIREDLRDGANKLVRKGREQIDTIKDRMNNRAIEIDPERTPLGV